MLLTVEENMTPEELRKKMGDPDKKVVFIEMTPEMQERLSRISEEILDELTKRTTGPAEGFMVLNFLLESMRDVYGISNFTKHEVPEAEN